MRRVRDAILDIFYPRLCIACGSYGAWVCDSCSKKLPAFSNISSPHIEEGIISHAVYSYDDSVVRAIVHALKYEGVKELASYMAHAMNLWWRKNQFLHGVPLEKCVLVPIPLHTNKLREREWNQAELIGGELASRLGLPIETGVLVRIKNTLPQSSLSRTERFANMRDAFSCHANSVLAGKTVILIDDVMTTGATLGQAAFALRKCGTADIQGFIFARGDQ